MINLVVLVLVVETPALWLVTTLVVVRPVV